MCRRRYGPRRPEERPPERGLVRLVPDHVLAHLRVATGEDVEVAAEGREVDTAELELARRVRIDGEHHLDSFSRGIRERTIELRLLLDPIRIGRTEAVADHDLPQADHPRLGEEPLAAVVGVLGRVVVDADPRGCRRTHADQPAAQRSKKQRDLSRPHSHPDPDRRALSPKGEARGRLLERPDERVEQGSAPNRTGSCAGRPVSISARAIAACAAPSSSSRVFRATQRRWHGASAARRARGARRSSASDGNGWPG